MTIKYLALFILLGLLVFFPGCTEDDVNPGDLGNNSDSGNIDNNVDSIQKEIKIDYFYYPTCPNCIACSPFIDYLQVQYNISIDKHNVHEEKEQPLAQKFNVTGVPMLVINFKSDRTYTFVGATKVPESEYIIANLTNSPQPERPFNTSYVLDARTCVNCHQPTEEQKLINPELERNQALPPPSTYSCNYCCHEG